MRLSSPIAALCVLALLAGCGGDNKPDGDTQVKQYLPKAEHIRCTLPRKGVTSCEADVPKRPVGSEHWHCRFEDSRSDEASSGSHACWSEDGSQESLAETG